VTRRHMRFSTHFDRTSISWIVSTLLCQVYTDHANLKHIIDPLLRGKETNSTRLNRIERWLLSVQHMEWVPHWIQGPKNAWADTISRMPRRVPVSGPPLVANATYLHNEGGLLDEEFEFPSFQWISGGVIEFVKPTAP
jgi:hypothetical protein